MDYLLFTPSPYTADDLRSYKGLHAYNKMCCGWVRDCQARKFGKCLVKCKVCREIDFSSAKSLKRKLDNKIKSTRKMESASTSTAMTPSKLPKPTWEEADKLFKSLHECSFRSAIISVVPPYSDAFVPKPVMQAFSTVLTELRDEDTSYKLLTHHTQIHRKLHQRSKPTLHSEAKHQHNTNSKMLYHMTVFPIYHTILHVQIRYTPQASVKLITDEITYHVVVCHDYIRCQILRSSCR